MHETQFILRHKTEKQKNKMITMDIDDIDKTVHWDGLKLAVKMNIAEGFNFEAQTNYPLVVLNMALADAKQKHEGRRPKEEM